MIEMFPPKSYNVFTPILKRNEKKRVKVGENYKNGLSNGGKQR